jgi:KaiC/GvpD/RAD55 family RecA-like ATPase
MDCSAIVLNKLLTERSLDLWSRLKLVFLDAAFSSLYSAIAKYYDQYSTIPSFDELELTLREGPASRTLATLRLADNPDISSEVAITALIDQYTQNETVKLLDKFIDKLPIYDTQEIKEGLSTIVLTLDEKTLTTEGVYSMADIMLFRDATDLARHRVHLGFNNIFDSTLAGMARQEMLLIGGRRGAGKSIVCSNIQVSQYEAGDTCVYFTIEMIAHETLERNMSILANVPHSSIKKNTLTDEEMLRVIKARASMFENSDDLVDEFRKTRDRYKFEQRLVREKSLKPDNQMIIIDDRALTITSLDLHLGRLKSKFGDKLKVCVVDYLNKIVVEGGHNQFDWQPQVVVSDKLKNLGRKYDLVMVSPYQIDEGGEARFAKGILDAADIALVMEAHDKEKGAVSFKTSKIRGGSDLAFTSPINWDSLRISPISIDAPDKPEAIKKAGKKTAKQAEAVKPDSDSDIPWDV